MLDDLTGKVVLVTGGSSGIGRAAALAFARAGARVSIAARGVERGRSVRSEIEALGGEAEFFPTDVSSAAEVEKLVTATVDVFGRLDCAFNNAGTLEVGAHTPLVDLSEADFDRSLALNLKSVWLCMKHEIRVMLRQGGGGAIVNTSSVNGLGGVAGGSAYASAKAGILALTKSAAQENAAGGIRVNALVAGGFRTPMLEGVFEQVAGGDPIAVVAAAAQVSQMVPLGRIGNPAEAAEAAVWLCSESASYVTGHSMIVDGGLTAWAR
jgi:NAD(P)-dependent dehydrogenase (short-subunit alcohol dehydrogenase family)